MKVFISYAGDDRFIAEKISRNLPEEKFESYFRPRKAVSGEDFRAEIKSAISSCEGVIFLISASFFKTGSFTLTELQFVEDKWDKPGNHLLPVLLPGTIDIKEIPSPYLSDMHIFEPEGDVVSAVCHEAEKKWFSTKEQPESKIDIVNYTSPKSSDQENENPYRALDHFGPNHAKYFFGRKSFVSKLIEKVSRQNFVAILGASGTGKSSVVLAGLVPELHKEPYSDWKFTYFRLWNDSPLQALTKALFPLCTGINQEDLLTKLKQGQENKDPKVLGEILVEIQCKNSLLLVADQFEEVFAYDNSSTPESSEKEQADFLYTLIEGIKYADGKRNSSDPKKRIVLITTIQDTERDKSNLFTDNIIRDIDYLGALGSDHFDEVVKGPLGLKGKIVEKVVDKLKEQFVTDCKINNLPLLQYTLAYLWDKRTESKDGYTIDLNVLGEFDGKGMASILDKTANELYEELGGKNKEEVFKKLFLNFIDVESEDNPTLHTRSKDNLGDSWELVQELAKSGLIKTYKTDKGVDNAEIAHEALINYWGKLKDWVDVAKINVEVKVNLKRKAEEWGRNNPKRYIGLTLFLRCQLLFKEDHSLLRGADLEKALIYEKKTASSLPDIQKNFLRTSQWQSWNPYSRTILLALVVVLIVGLIMHRDEDRLKGAAEQLEIDTLGRLSFGEKNFTDDFLDKRYGSGSFACESSKEEESNKFKKTAPEGCNNQQKISYDNSIKKFKAHLDTFPDDPEARIYMNNAIARRDKLDLLTIAVNVPIQRNKTAAKEILRGVAQAQEEVNDKWKSDKRALQIMIGSDDNDPIIAKRIAEWIVKKEDILAVVGHNASRVSNEVIEAYQNELIMISPTSYSMKHEELKKVSKNYIYSVAYPVSTLVEALADYSVDKNKKKKIEKTIMLFCYDSEAHDKFSLEKGFLSKGFKRYADNPRRGDERILDDERCDFKELDKSIIKELGEEVTDLFLSANIKTIPDSLIFAEENKDKKLGLYATPTLYSDDAFLLHHKKGKDLEGMILAVYWYPPSSTDKYSYSSSHENVESTSFFTRAKELWQPKENELSITWRVAMAYDATRVIIKGLEGINGAPTRKELQEKVAAQKIVGATGSIQFAEDGSRKNRSTHLMEVRSEEEVCKKEVSKKVMHNYKFFPISLEQLECKK